MRDAPATTLDVLAENPESFQSLPAPLQAHLYRRAARLEAELRAYLLAAGRHTRDDRHGARDQILTIREAADLLRVSRDTLYRRWRRLDFAFKDPLDARLKFRRAGLERYVESLRGGPAKARI